MPLRLTRGHPRLSPERGHLDALRHASPQTVRSRYIPYSRQPFGENATWLKRFQPEWLGPDWDCRVHLDSSYSYIDAMTGEAPPTPFKLQPKTAAVLYRKLK